METVLQVHDPIDLLTAYRLASIGLDGNPNRKDSVAKRDKGLPIGFDRIRWKPNHDFRFSVFTGLPIGFDRIRWKLLDIEVSLRIGQRAYRLASIGLDGNSRNNRT